MWIVEVLMALGMPAILACLLLGVKLFILEGYMRRGREQKAPLRGKFDRTSRILNGTAFVAALFLTPVLGYFGIGHFPFSVAIVAWCGLALMLCGITLRQWAIATMGNFYTRALVVTVGGRLVKQGPYRAIRHPGYLGNILTWSGFGLAFDSWIAPVIIFLSMSAAYVYRIRAEEPLLIEAFGEQYITYMKNTWRLIPYIY